MKFIRFTILFFGLFSLIACGDDDGLSSAEQLAADIETIENYLASNNLTAQSTESGLHYIIEEQGTGAVPADDQPFIFGFDAYFTDGSLLGSSYYGAEVAWLSQLLPGFTEGIPFFNIGGKGKLLMPSALAFGTTVSGGNPPSSVVIFDLELPTYCLSDTTFAGKQKCLDRVKINRYLSENGLVADSTASGLYYIIEKEGIGNAKPTLNDIVEVKYKGSLLNGVVFDETKNGATAKFPLGGLIQGWQEGIRLLKKEGKCKLFIPSDLAYGSNPQSNLIPRNAALVFEVELIDF